MSNAYIITAVRTPIGRFGGSFKDLSPADLAAHVMKAALSRAGVPGDELNFYVFGNVLRAGHGQLIPRQAAMKAGIPKEVDGMQVDMVCSSGMMAVMTAANMIKAGEADVILAGGTECMSNTGFYLSSRARWGYKFLLGSPEGLLDLMLHDGLTDPMSGEAMGSQTERLAAEHGIARRDLDEIAAHSQQRSAEASDNGWFSDEIVPVEIKGRKGPETINRDEGIRPETTLETLGALRPAFQKEGVLTAGNSSQISDGAAALLVVSEEAVERLGLHPIARVMASGWSAGEPWRFPEAPIPAIESVLKKTRLEVSDFDLFENNEAFAINSVLMNRMLDVPYEKLNVHGGGIALGHPIGASGARIITTLLHAMRRRGDARGMASICHGTGGGTAIAIEMV